MRWPQYTRHKLYNDNELSSPAARRPSSKFSSDRGLGACTKTVPARKTLWLLFALRLDVKRQMLLSGYN